jgi:signal transduction histidine kinase/streptogramin lyase
MRWTRSRRISILCAVFSLAVSAPVFCLDRDRNIAQFHYTFWSEKEGAPSQITALAQTEDGYLWIGSAGGLFRFDGVRFEEFTPQPGVDLPSHSVYSLMATPDGGLWVAFEPTGLAFIKNGSLTVFKQPGELPPSPIHCFARDLDGTIWAGTETGLVRREGNRWVSVGRDWNFTPEMIRYLLVDRAGTLWVATINRVAFLRRGSRTFEVGGSLGTGVTTLSQGPNGKIWFADDGSGVAGPVPMSGRSAQSERPSVVADGLHELLFDRDGALWITRMDFGIVRIRSPEKLSPRTYHLRDAEVESFGAREGFTAGYAYKLLEDREGNIWIGCSNGLIRLRHNNVVPVKLPEGYQRLTLLAGDHADLWVGTIYQKPILHLQDSELIPQKAPGQVASVLREPNGDVWWGGRSGVLLQRGTSFKFFPLPKGSVQDWMYDMTTSTPDGGLWIKLGGIGFVHFREGVWDLHAWPRGVSSEGTFRFGPSASYRDPSGALWLGYTSGEIYRLEGTQATLYSQREGLNLGRIKVIRGQGGHIWLGGELGIEFFRNGRFQPMNVATDDALGTVSGIIETSDGSLWLNEMKGIVHIPPEEVRQFIADPKHRVTDQRFGYLDGLPGAPQMSVTNATSVETTDGRLWFATDDGLAWIDPARLVTNPLPPPVSILSIKSDNRLLPAWNATKLPAGTHNIEINYTALSLSIPERVQFRYKLEGVDADWNSVGTRRQADYNNLGPGQYQFRVIASNSDGVWNPAGAVFDFSIAPTYYQTPWFRIGFILAVLVMVWTLYRLRLHSLKTRSAQLLAINAQLEGEMTERRRAEQALSEAQMELTRVNRIMLVGQTAASIAHEVNQPITAVIINAKTGLRWLAAETPNLEKARQALARIVNDTTRAADVIRRIRALVGRAPLRKEALNLNDMVNEVLLMVEGEIHKNGVAVNTQLDERLPHVLADRIQLQQVMLNLIKNAIEAMSAQSLRELTITSKQDRSNEVTIAVADSGPGLDPNDLDKLFNHFYTTKPGGMGLGLAICQAIIEAHGGRLWATQNQPQGAVFQFTLPLEE